MAITWRATTGPTSRTVRICALCAMQQNYKWYPCHRENKFLIAWHQNDENCCPCPCKNSAKTCGYCTIFVLDRAVTAAVCLKGWSAERLLNLIHQQLTGKKTSKTDEDCWETDCLCCHRQQQHLLASCSKLGKLHAHILNLSTSFDSRTMLMTWTPLKGDLIYNGACLQ